MHVRDPRRAFALVMSIAICSLALRPVHADDRGPQNAVRRFCGADAMGARLAGQWSEIGSLVVWPFDPAWDRVLFITGYLIGAPQALEDGHVAVDVDYTVVGEAMATGFEATAYLERVTFVLNGVDDANWRIVAPMVAPHVFGHRFRGDEVVDAIKHGRGAFVSNSLFVQQLLQAAGWEVPQVPTAALLDEKTYRQVGSAAKGDLVVYVQGGVPYHVGLLEARDRVVSSTLNGGIVRATSNAFLGEVRYLRLLAPAKVPTTISTPTPSS